MQSLRSAVQTNSCILEQKLSPSSVEDTEIRLVQPTAICFLLFLVSSLSHRLNFLSSGSASLTCVDALRNSSLQIDE